MHISPSDLKKFVEENPKLVKRRESARWPGLYVLKYTANVFYDALWGEHDMIKYARGLVVDEDYNVVVKPFTKVFNYGENGTTIDRDELCEVIRKVNGFMGVATYRPELSDKIIYSTTGSLDSDFVDLIEKHVSQYEDYIRKFPDCSFIFEICDETDPHIIQEQLGAWLIGSCSYHNDGFIAEAYESLLDQMADTMECLRPEHYRHIRFSDVVQMSKECKHEGFMVYGGGVSLKIKSPYYLTQKLFARMGETKLDRMVDSPSDVKRRIDEEYYPLLDHITSNKDQFKALDEQQRLEFMVKFLEGNYE